MQTHKITPFYTRQTYAPAGGLSPSNASTPLHAQLTHPMPTSLHYASMLAFGGGNSVDLEKSLQMLEEYEEKHNESIFPPAVKGAMKELIEEGNPYKWTLIDVHKDVFGRLSTEGSLEKIKEMEEFKPLFDNVVPSDAVSAKNGSFINRARAGELKTFNPKNELSVDLIHLLYAEGFSTNDLKAYTDNVDVYSSVKNKLGIPFLHPHYAHVLKLSDKDFNERLVNKTAATRLDNAERKKQSGEPVFISKRSISQIEAQNTGKELLEHFEQNVNEDRSLYSQSEAQRHFYKEHPQIAAKLTDLVLIAWGGDKNSSLTSKMKKHFKKEGVEIKISDLDPFEITEKNTKILKSFWDKNPWASKAFSQKVKDLRENEITEITPQNMHGGYLFKVFPSGLVVDFIQWKKQNGIFEQSFYNPFMNNKGDFENGNKYAKTYDATSKLLKDSRYSSILLKTNVQTVKDLEDAIKKGELKDVGGTLGKIKAFALSVSGKRYDEIEGRVHEFISANEIAQFYQSVVENIIKNGKEPGAKELLDFLYKKLDENYADARAKFDTNHVSTPEPKTNKVQKYSLVPKGYAADFEIWQQKSGIKEPLSLGLGINEQGMYDADGGYDKANEVLKRYNALNPVTEDMLTDALTAAIVTLYKFINNKRSSLSSDPKTRTHDTAIKLFVQSDIITPFEQRRRATNGKDAYTTCEEAQSGYQRILIYAVHNNLSEYLNILQTEAEKNYQISKSKYGFDPNKAVLDK